MTDYTARNVLLKDANGNYLIPYTEKADLSLSNLNATGEAHFQAPLVSGTNIKTINGSSVLGSGDLTVTATITGGASTIVTDNLTASKALVSDSSGKVAASSVTGTELGYLSGVTSAIQTQINDKANTNLSNLTATGEAHFANPALTNTGYTTNRILEIPQDIQLELSNGTLTLKAGSKVYVPNGAGVFDEYILTADISSGDISSIDTAYFFFLNPSKTGLSGTSVVRSHSGTTAPSSPSTGVYWYDTTNNSVKRWDGSTWVGGFSLPFCIVSSGATNIDQVFNGFGYIGSTLFALPNVKVQIPNGRNADGTCKTSIVTKTNVMTQTFTLSGDTWLDVFVAASQTYCLRDHGKIHYDQEENLIIDTAGNGRFVIGQAHFQGGKCVEVLQKTVDSVINSNEFYQLKDNAVTLTDNQTISGVKTITPPSTSNIHLHLKRRDLATNNTTPTTEKYETLIALANDNSTIGAVQWHQSSTGYNHAKLYAKRGNVLSTIDAVVRSDGVAFTSAPTPTDTTSTSSAQIATVGWVNSTGNNVVHLDGTETISGAKTFTSAPTINGGNGPGLLTIKNNVTAYGTSAVDLVVATSNSMNQFLVHFQEGNKWVGTWSQNPTTKGVVFSVAGCAECHAPTPSSATDNSAKIATTAWVNTSNKTGYGIGAPNYSAAVDIVLDSSYTFTATENGYIIFTGSTSSFFDLMIDNNVAWRISNNSGYTPAIIPVGKGSVCVFGSNLTINYLRFVPCK